MVAIILVNYNRAEDTIECIQSIQKVKGVDYKIVVVDNCSIDDSIDKLKKAQEVYNFILIRAKNNSGFSAGNNIGIKYFREADYFLSDC